MGQLTNAIQECIKSGEYFIDARKWYNLKYILPLSHRSLLLLLCTIFTLLLTLICININILLPINKGIIYLIKNDAKKQAFITNTKHSTLANPYISIANIMLQNYLNQQEGYNYDILKVQITLIKNACTSIVFMQFAYFMNIDNPLSLVIRYQKLYRRSINKLSINNINDNEAVVTFESLAKNSTDGILENMVWEARIGFIMDSISTNTSPDMPFNFTVTSYKLKLLRNKNQTYYEATNNILYFFNTYIRYISSYYITTSRSRPTSKSYDL